MTTVKSLFTSTVIIFILFTAMSNAGTIKNKNNNLPNILTQSNIGNLLVRPNCLDGIIFSDEWDNTIELQIPSNGITLSAKLYLPNGEGPWPAVILVPGGFNQTELIMRSPRFQAPRLAQCGYAALVYYKRGTGLSGGSFATATYDDFINDVGNIAKYLACFKNITPEMVGVCGGSDGGFVGTIAAARFSEISFAINKSGPIVPNEEKDNYNIAYALAFRGYADTLVKQVLPLWEKHHSAWAKNDTIKLQEVSEEIKLKRKQYDMFLLPTPFEEVFTDSNLIFLWPRFRSASTDFLSEIRNIQVKYLAIYGENDPIVPVFRSIDNIEKLFMEGGNENYNIILLENVGHSFENKTNQQQIPVIRIVINWLNLFN